MSDDGTSGAKKAAQWIVIVSVVIAALGVLADVTGLFAFVTGKNLPEILAPAPSSTPMGTQGPRPSALPATAAVPSTAPPTVTEPTSTAFTPIEPPPQQLPQPQPTTDAVKNFQLGISPGEFPAANPRMITIETSDGGLGTFVDVEIADPTANGGVCPKLTDGPCNLIYSGGEFADESGRMSLQFEWFGNAPGHDNIHHPGRYTITVQDRGTGTILSIDFTAQ